MNDENIKQVEEHTGIISNWSQNLLKNIGFDEEWINYLNMIFLLILTVLVVAGVQWIVKWILTKVMKKTSSFKRLKIFGFLTNRNFPIFLAMLVSYAIIKGTVPIIFEAFPKALKIFDKFADIYLVYTVVRLFSTIVNSFGDLYKTKPKFQDKPVDSYTQVINVINYIFGIIIAISILLSQKFGNVVTGLGAMSAILMLVFRDIILGFVASIQVSTNDILRIGDWVTMSGRGVDGDVEQISLTTVKVRNFDNTISTVPPYAFVSETFQNWRGMQESGARRFKRTIYIKQSSIRYIQNDELPRFKKIQGLTKFIETRKDEIDTYNQNMKVDTSIPVNGRHLTNVGIYRKYLEIYLQNNPNIDHQKTVMVRQLESSTKGLALELYAFTATTTWSIYENIISDTVDHALAVLPFFDLESFEEASSPLAKDKNTTESTKEENTEI